MCEKELIKQLYKESLFEHLLSENSMITKRREESR